jgi:hypothetical protein
MKTMRFFIVLAILNNTLFANITPPQAYISEVYIETSDNWWLELGFYEDPEILIDSVIVETTSGSALITDFITIDLSETDVGFPFLALITNDNLEHNLSMIRQGDFIKIYSYIGTTANINYLAFGKYADSEFLQFREGLSIAKVGLFNNCSGFYSLDNTPSPGVDNEDEGVAGNVNGYLYDKDHNPIINSEVKGYVCSVSTDENGYYEGDVLSKTYYFDTINLWTGQWETYIYLQDTISVLPDSSYSKDLVLLSSPSTIIEPMDEPDVPVITSFPNPFTEFTAFYIFIPPHINFKTADFEIFSSSGQRVFLLPLNVYTAKVVLPGEIISTLKPGVYHAQLLIDGVISEAGNTIIKL